MDQTIYQLGSLPYHVQQLNNLQISRLTHCGWDCVARKFRCSTSTRLLASSSSPTTVINTSESIAMFSVGLALSKSNVLFPRVAHRISIHSCQVCRGLKKEDNSGQRLACEITSKQLLNAHTSRHCKICSFIVDGILLYEDSTWTIGEDVSLAYLYALSNRGDTLTLEIYFRTERPKLVLEYFHTEG
jgi:hypothetical protein